MASLLSSLTRRSSSITFTTLTEACVTGNPSSVEKAVRNKVKIESDTLTEACRTEKPEIVTIVISAGALPNDETLSVACSVNNSSIVRKVLLLGAVATAKTFEIADRIGNQDILDLLEDMRPKKEAASLTPKQEVKTESKTLNQFILSFIENEETLSAAIDQAIKAGATATAETLDIAIGHCKHLKEPGKLITQLHEKAKAEPSAQTLSFACKCLLNDHKAYENLILATLATGAKPDSSTFQSIRWTSNTDPLFCFANSTVSTLFESGLKPKATELISLQNQMKPSQNGRKNDPDQKAKNCLLLQIMTGTMFLPEDKQKF